MTAELGFVGFLALTLVLLGVVVATGLRALRRIHVTCVALALAALATTIYYAVKMGEHYDLASAGVITPIHLNLTKITTLAYLAPLVTGWMTTRNPARRPWHRRCAFVVLALTVATAVTGTWMVLASDRLPIAGE